jgi:putative lipoic acid-binding regulatory protein
MEPVGLVYPCEFPVKVFVRPDAEVEQRLETLVRGHLQPEAVLQIERRASAQGKYLCLTLIFVAEDEAHLTRITKAIGTDPAVVLSL